MLALVTCHIFPPSICYGKKMNSWHLTSRLTARSFSESTASRVRSGRCPRQCTTLLHGQMYLQEKTPVLQFGHTLEQNSSIRPIISYLWMVDLVMRFFSCGVSLWRSSTRIRPKKGPAPWTLFLTPAPRPLQITFFGWWSWRYVVVPFCKDKCIFSKKPMCCNLRARWHKILEFVPSCPICGWLAWWCDFFPVGPTFEDHPQVFSQKRSSPWILFLTPAPWPLEVTFFGWWKWTYVVVPLLQGQMSFQKKTPVLQFGRVDTKFLNSSHHVLSVDDWPGDGIFFLWGQPLKIIPQVFSQKKVQQLGFYFDTCASASSSHFFGWWSWTCVSVPFCKDNCIFSKKTCVLQIGRALTQNSWIRPIMSYLWMIGLLMRLFSCGANLWRSSASIQSKKVQPLGFYFDPCALASWSHFLVGEGEHMCLYPFAKSCKESYPLK